MLLLLGQALSARERAPWHRLAERSWVPSGRGRGDAVPRDHMAKRQLSPGGRGTQRIVDVVITGGPAAGKSTVLVKAVEALQDRGWRVFVVPEIPTLLAQSGTTLARTGYPGYDAYLGFQGEVVRLQLAFEGAIRRLAELSEAEKAAIVIDGGAARGGAYVDDGDFPRVCELGGAGLGEVQVRHDAVVYLQSSAHLDGAWVGTANNEARIEASAEVAAALDEVTLRQWVTHPHLEIVPAVASFEEKLRLAVAAVLRAVGDPEPIEVERKYLLERAPGPDTLRSLGAKAVRIEQTYLFPEMPGTEERVRRREVDGLVSYSHTVKADRADGSRQERERHVDGATYEALLTRRDPALQTVSKTRHVFVQGASRFELDELHGPLAAWLLEVEVPELSTPVAIPAELGPVREVTAERAWRNAALAAAGA